MGLTLLGKGVEIGGAVEVEDLREDGELVEPARPQTNA